MPAKPPFPPSSLCQQPCHHSLHHLFVSNPATIPSIISLSAAQPPFPPLLGRVSVGLSGEVQDSMAPGTNNEKSPAVS